MQENKGGCGLVLADEQRHLPFLSSVSIHRSGVFGLTLKKNVPRLSTLFSAGPPEYMRLEFSIEVFYL